MAETETIDRLYLELAQVTRGKTSIDVTASRIVRVWHTLTREERNHLMDLHVDLHDAIDRLARAAERRWGIESEAT